jgi:N-acetylneuraminate synthase
LKPSEDNELELDQIDYLRNRYPDNVIGLSTHEYHDWSSSVLMSYAKGARTWERHVDIDYNGVPVSSYCSLPEQCDTWFKSYHKAVEMCGGRSTTRRVISRKETEYLDQLVRGAYARRDLEPGYKIHKDSFEKDFYLAIPLRKGQLSCREIMNGETLTQEIRANQPLTIDHIDGPYATNPTLKNLIKNRGL